MSSRIQINQELTPPISLKKGIRQGCPISMLLFVLATDILSQKISHSHLLRGVTLSQSSLKILQYADDTTILLTESDSIPAAKKVLTQFSTHANLEINLKKSKLMSTSHYLSEQIARHFPDIVATNEITILGIPFSLHHDSGNALWEKTIQKISAIAQQNSHENMSLYGKSTLVNALLMSHILMAARLFFPSQSQIKRLNTIVFKFLWFPSFLEPIKRSKLVKDHKDGGLRFPDIQSKIKAVFMMKLLLTI